MAMNLEQKYEKELNEALKLLSIPEGHSLRKVVQGVQNGESVLVFRYLKDEYKNINIGEEHFSFTLEESSNKVLGFTWFDKRFIKGQTLLSEEKTQDIARNLLGNIEPTLLQSIDHKWTAEHDELISVDGKNISITGMKYKCYVPVDDSYAWVIVGNDSKVITFEQEIIWENGRVTEKWLHDSWLKDNLKEN